MPFLLNVISLGVFSIHSILKSFARKEQKQINLVSKDLLYIFQSPAFLPQTRKEHWRGGTRFLQCLFLAHASKQLASRNQIKLHWIRLD